MISRPYTDAFISSQLWYSSLSYDNLLAMSFFSGLYVREEDLSLCLFLLQGFIRYENVCFSYFFAIIVHFLSQKQEYAILYNSDLIIGEVFENALKILGSMVQYRT